jgi:predicted nucleic acid-binding protein
MIALTDNPRALVDTNVVVYAYDLDDPTKHAIARELIENLLIRRRLVLSALSFWDALIWSAPVENNVAVIYTEDFQDGREVEGVRFVNPFGLSAESPP